MIYIVLPAYNEEVGLPLLLQSIRRVMEEADLPYEVIVVDDGSGDGTWGVIEASIAALPVRGIRQRENRGLAEALRSGLQAAIEKATADDVIVTMDADNTHAPGLVMRMLTLLREGDDVVIASRYVAGARTLGVPLHRRVLSRAAGLLLKAAFPIKGVRDYTCGFRAYRAAVLKDVFRRYPDDLFGEKGFSCMVGLLLRLRELNPIMAEVPMLLRYDRKHGMSKMKVVENSLATLELVIRGLLRR